MAIQGFKDKDTETLFKGIVPRRFPSDLVRTAQRKLRMVHTAKTLADLKVPPANRLEPLAGDRKGQHSIRINDQFRVCFKWTENGPDEVEITDYH